MFPNCLKKWKQNIFILQVQASVLLSKLNKKKQGKTQYFLNLENIYKYFVLNLFKFFSKCNKNKSDLSKLYNFFSEFTFVELFVAVRVFVSFKNMESNLLVFSYTP